MTIFRLKTTNPQSFFLSNINLCKWLQTWITSIIPFQNVYQDTSLRQIFIFQFSFFPHASTKILITYFISIALSCNPFMIQANSHTNALHHHFSEAYSDINERSSKWSNSLSLSSHSTTIFFFSVFACFTWSHSIWRILIRSA